MSVIAAGGGIFSEQLRLSHFHLSLPIEPIDSCEF